MIEEKEEADIIQARNMQEVWELKDFIWNIL